MDTMFDTVPTYRSAAEINQAMSRVYGHMMAAVLNSMLVSYLVGSSPELVAFFFTGAMKWVVIFAPLLFIFAVPVILESNPPAPVAIGTLHAFAGLMGLSLSAIFIVYAMTSIFTAFMGAAVLFGTMSFFGYFTKKDLSELGSLLFVGLIAIIIASIINIFIGSTVTQMVISALAIIIFLGLTAYDTQQIREMVSVESNPAIEVMGALTLYLDFINIFLSLLQLFGDKKGD